ncbi:hypothetical protein LPJ70_003719 [Coemansia sp. RSA 2708]|nr:hypothetical protein LPJ70_003719 [Coemansia sp. RSA 2708]
MRRDTVTFPAYSYLALRFLADSPFVALVHCHAQQHKQRGMAFTLVVAPELLQQTQRMPEKMLEFCRKLGVKTSGNAAGNSGLDLTGLPSAQPIEDNTF